MTGCDQQVHSVRAGASPQGIAIDTATGTIYVANIGDNFSGTTDTVSVINGATCNGVQHSGCAQTPPTVTVGAGPDAVAVDPATDTVYVANNGSITQGNTVSVINGATCNGIQHSGCGQVPPSVTVGHGPFWIALDQGTHTAYTAN